MRKGSTAICAKARSPSSTTFTPSVPSRREPRATASSSGSTRSSSPSRRPRTMRCGSRAARAERRPRSTLCAPTSPRAPTVSRCFPEHEETARAHSRGGSLVRGVLGTGDSENAQRLDEDREQRIERRHPLRHAHRRGCRGDRCQRGPIGPTDPACPEQITNEVRTPVNPGTRSDRAQVRSIRRRAAPGPLVATRQREPVPPRSSRRWNRPRFVCPSTDQEATP